MKKTLLTAVATLFLATGTAHATDQLPEAMLGVWCRTQLTTFFDTYVRGACEDDDAKAIFIRKDFYIERRYYNDSCVYEKIEKTFDAYLIYSHCKEPNNHIVEEAQIIGKELVIRNIPES